MPEEGFSEPGAFGSFLRWLDRPFQVVGNALQGNFASAGKQLIDFGGEALDAALPFGDWIPQATTERDFIEPSSLVGLDDAHWLPKTAADVVIGTVLNPASWFTFGGAGAAGGVAKGLSRTGELAKRAALASPAADDAARAAVKAAQKNIKLSKKPGIFGESYGLSQSEQHIDALAQLRKSLNAKKRGIRKELQEAVDPGSDLASQTTANSAKLSQLQRQLDEIDISLDDNSQAHRIALRTLQGEAREGVAAGASLSSQSASLKGLLESGLKNRARTQKGADGIRQAVDDAFVRIGDDFSEANIRSVLEAPEFAKTFRQGGTFFAGQRIADSGAGLKMAERAFDMLPPGLRSRIVSGTAKPREIAGRLWQQTKRAAGWDFLDSASKGMRFKALSAGALSTRSATEKITQVFKGVNDETDRIIAQAFDNLNYAPDGHLIAEKTIIPASEESVDSVMKRLQSLRDGTGSTDVDLSKVDWDAAERVVRQLDDHHVELWEELRTSKSIGQPGSDLNAALGGASEMNLGRGAYLRRDFSGERIDDYGDVSSELMGRPQSIRGRTLQTDEDMRRFLAEQPDVTLERSAMKRSMGRAAKQGEILTRTKLAQDILGDGAAVLNDDKTRARVAETLTNLARQEPEFARLLQDMASGMQPRGASLVLSKLNRWFKPAAVYGLMIPRIAAITRNQVGGIWQTASEAGWEAALSEAKRAPANIWNSIAAGVEKYLKRDLGIDTKLRRRLKDVDEVFTQFAGDTPAIREALRRRDPLLLDAFDAGVFEGFVDSEELLRQVLRSSKGQRFQDFMDAPGVMFRTLENHMRLGLFMDLRKQGLSAQRAGQVVRDSFLDYSIQSVSNRRVRDILPFFAFTAGSIAQQSRLIARKPGVAVGVSQLFGGTPDEPVSPWIADQPSFRVGNDEEGNSLFATSLGLPVEALNFLPNLSDKPMSAGRDIERSVIGSSQPMLKSLYGYVSGRDPFFGSTYGSYDKTPYIIQALGAPESGELARLYHEAAGTGLLQPLETALTTADRLSDPRMSTTEKMLNALTGVRLASSDPDRAMIQILQERLARDPKARKFTKYYGESPEIDALKAAQKRAKEKRQAQMVAE